MAKGQKHIRITEWLANCGENKVRLTFQQLNNISSLPKSAYSVRQLWANSGQSFSNSWLSANYKVTSISMSEQWVEFTLQSAPKTQGKISLEHEQPKNMVQKVDSQLLNELIDCGYMCIDAIHRDCNHRYRSWEYCYRVFSEPCDFCRERVDYLALHLAWYLGSWGMLRNSFLQDKDYKVHVPVVEILMNPKWKILHGLSAENFVDPSLTGMIMELTHEIANCYQKYAEGTPTDTLLTKIALGTIGCVPAYDRFFTYAVRKTGIASGTFGRKSLFQLGKFYLEHNAEMEALRLQCPSEVTSYPPAKVIDMCFFGYGLKHDSEARQ